jgi:hypothetical protein
MWSSGSWQVFHGVDLGVFSHRSAALHRLVRRMAFATNPVLKRQWLPNRRLSTRTVGNRLKSAGLKSRRVINGHKSSAENKYYFLNTLDLNTQI